MSKLSIDPGSSVTNLTGSWRTQTPVMKNKWPPCGQTCPASEDIQAWLALASESQWQAAWRKLTARNPLPAVMGRVCYHPCESACNRKHLDSAVNIHAMEYFLGEMALANGWQHQKLNDNENNATGGKKIAVVGAGPAGLSCAYQLALRGYAVTIFDAAEEAGGTLWSGIPEYRLPKNILKQEIEAILKLGVTLVLNCTIGDIHGNAPHPHKRISTESLITDYDAIFLGIGALKPRLFQNSQYTDQHVLTGMDFLRRVNQGEELSLPKRVAVIGGGNTAIDVARCLRRLDCDVTVVCAQDPHGAHLAHPGAEIPASELEVTQAQREGVEIIYRTAVSRLVYSGKHLNGVETCRVDKIHDRHGNFNPVLFEGTETFIAANLVIFAIGQEVDWCGLERLIDSGLSKVFIGGDAAGNPRFAATAIGSGFENAMSIIDYLSGQKPYFDTHKKAEVTYKNLNLSYYAQSHRQTENAGEKENSGFVDTISLNESTACKEALRCLSCGVCFYCDNCWHFCPDAAIIKQADNYTIDYDFCKGCGICAQECPCGYIDMHTVLHE